MKLEEFIELYKIDQALGHDPLRRKEEIHPQTIEDLTHIYSFVNGRLDLNPDSARIIYYIYEVGKLTEKGKGNIHPRDAKAVIF